MKFLVPTDFSKNADHAVRYASVLANAVTAELLLIHVNIPPVTRGNIAEALLAKEIDRLTNEASVKLSEISGSMAEEFDISCEYIIRMGNPVVEIIHEAKNNAIDLIVMGTAGASGLDKFLFGSNTVSVIDSAPCPVLAVPIEAHIAPPRKITFATNYQDNDIETMRGLVKLVSGLHPEITILHIAGEVSGADRDMVEQFSKTVALELSIPQPYYYVMPHDDILKGIDLFIESAESDLIALATRRRGAFERLFDPSLTRKLTYQAKFPLLVFQSILADNII